MTRRILIVGGCPRSGTTALTRLLNCHPELLIGDERYYWLFDQRRIAARHFERARFLDLREADRHWAEGRAPWPPCDPDGSDGSGDLGARYDRARFVGDKYPRLSDVTDHLAAALPDAQLVWIVRNPLSVAESYEARRADEADAWFFGLDRAMVDWNRGVGGIAAAPGALVLSYERLFAGAGDPARLFRALDLDPAPAMTGARAILDEARRVTRRDGPRCEATRFEVARRADWSAFRAATEDRCLLA